MQGGDGKPVPPITQSDKDSASFTENLMDILDLTREEAERWVGNSGDVAGTIYPITDHWQTKFSATVKIER